MDVMGVARAIGLDVTNREVTGTIDEQHVLDALDELIEGDPENGDLFSEAAARVQRARSAGVEQLPAERIRARSSEVSTTQLRYRSEMVDLFTDLAIDVGLRDQHHLVPTA